MSDDDRREQILAAARELAAASGLATVTVRSVAARAGIGASTLRYYFPSQRELHDAVAIAALDEQLDDRRIHDRRVAPATRLTECLAQFLPDRDEHIHELEAWFALQGSARQGDARSASLGALTRGAARRVDGWLAVLEAEGALRPVARDRHLATALATVDGLCLGLLSATVTTSVAEAMQTLSDVVRHTIIGDDRE